MNHIHNGEKNEGENRQRRVLKLRPCYNIFASKNVHGCRHAQGGEKCEPHGRARTVSDIKRNRPCSNSGLGA